MRRGRLVPLLLLVGLVACGDSNPSDDPPGSGGPNSIRGDERLGWDQSAENAAELATFRYAAYVDGARSQLTDVSCSTEPGGAGFACTARLPSMSPGTHTLELAAFVTGDGQVIEGPRSAPLVVTVASSITADVRGEPTGRVASPRQPRVTSGLQLSSVAEGFSDITDLRVAPDGRIFVAERHGIVRIVESGLADPRPALIDADQVLSVAIDPAFETRQFIYALQADVQSAAAPVLRLVRYREAGGTLGERAVLLDGLVTDDARPSGVLRFGPDEKLYIAIDESAASRRTRPGEGAGTLLRLNADGTTPADQPGLDRVVSDGFYTPRGLDWEPRASALWMSDGAHSLDRLWAVPADLRRARLGLRDGEFRFRAPTGVHGIAFYRGEIPLLRGSLLVASESGFLRVRFDPRDARRVQSIQTLLDRPMRSLANAADGALYLASATEVFLVRAAGDSD